MIVNSYFSYLLSPISYFSKISGLITNVRKIVKIENILIIFQLIIFMLIYSSLAGNIDCWHNQSILLFSPSM
jgi:hypothetical protein